MMRYILTSYTKVDACKEMFSNEEKTIENYRKICDNKHRVGNFTFCRFIFVKAVVYSTNYMKVQT